MKYSAPGNPAILRNLVLRLTIVRFFGAELFLIGIFILAELFTSMWRFLAMEAALADILFWMLAGIPAHALEVLPVAFLFGITLTLAEINADGEFLVICGSGISVQSLTLPILLCALLMGGILLVSGDFINVPATVARDDVYRKMTGQKTGDARQVSELTIIADGGAYVYRIGYYSPDGMRIVDADIIGRNEVGRPVLRILAPSARWVADRWEFSDARVFRDTGDGSWTESTQARFSLPGISEAPRSFEVVRERPTLMSIRELDEYVQILKASGLPHAEALTEYHKRLSFLLTPLIVAGLSIAVSGIFRKNTLLMSLLFSLATATVYYVAQMLGALAAKTGWMEPFWAIWGVTSVFLIVSFLGYLRART